MHEPLAVWAMFGAFALAIGVTYARLPANELYHVSGSGLEGGASRALVYVAYPLTLAAIAIVAVALDRFLASVTERPARRAVVLASALSVVLCATVAWPGMLDQADLDAKQANVIPATGALLAFGITLWTARTAGVGPWTPFRPSDRLRILVAVPLVLLALPWVLADLGIFIDNVPLLGLPFRSDELSLDSEGHLTPAVHLGDHHGMNGVLLALTALLLSRGLHRMRESRLRTALALYLSLLLVYGIGNVANDAWLEQVVKRGWTSWQIPDVLRPEFSPEWGLLLLAGAGVYYAFWRRSMLRPS